jgi:hypothetical protein
MARPAELNGYPGPMHVLDLRDRLGLTPEQEAAVRSSFARMEVAAKPLGAELVERERALDRAFAGGAVTADGLRSAARSGASCSRPRPMSPPGWVSRRSACSG